MATPFGLRLVLWRRIHKGKKLWPREARGGCPVPTEYRYSGVYPVTGCRQSLRTLFTFAASFSWPCFYLEGWNQPPIQPNPVILNRWSRLCTERYDWPISAVHGPLVTPHTFSPIKEHYVTHGVGERKRGRLRINYTCSKRWSM